MNTLTCQVCRLYELMDRREFVKALRERYTDDEIEILVNTFRTKKEEEK